VQWRENDSTQVVRVEWYVAAGVCAHCSVDLGGRDAIARLYSIHLAHAPWQPWGPLWILIIRTIELVYREACEEQDGAGPSQPEAGIESVSHAHIPITSNGAIDLEAAPDEGVQYESMGKKGSGGSGCGAGGRCGWWMVLID
jgi:hypothetical protein